MSVCTAVSKHISYLLYLSLRVCIVHGCECVSSGSSAVPRPCYPVLHGASFVGTAVLQQMLVCDPPGPTVRMSEDLGVFHVDLVVAVNLRPWGCIPDLCYAISTHNLSPCLSLSSPPMAHASTHIHTKGMLSSLITGRKVDVHSMSAPVQNRSGVKKNRQGFGLVA